MAAVASVAAGSGCALTAAPGPAEQFSSSLQMLTPEALMAGLNIGQKATTLLLVYISLDALMQ